MISAKDNNPDFVPKKSKDTVSNANTLHETLGFDSSSIKIMEDKTTLWSLNKKPEYPHLPLLG